MGYRGGWYNDEKTILLFDVYEGWTWDEAHAIVSQQVAMMAEVEHGVHTIFYLHGLSGLPRGSALPNVRKLMRIQHPNERMTVFIGVTGFGQALANVVARAYGMQSLVAKYRFVSTMQQALEEIERYERMTSR
jgi:hypothetical protein